MKNFDMIPADPGLENKETAVQAELKKETAGLESLGQELIQQAPEQRRGRMERVSRRMKTLLLSMSHCLANENLKSKMVDEYV